MRSDERFGSRLVVPSGSESLEAFQHLSIPPDFNIHFTGSAGRLFFKPVDTSARLALLFSFISRPVDTYPDAKGKWTGGVALMFPGIPYGEDSRFLLDFFVHREDCQRNEILDQPPTARGARYDGMANGGNYLGPFGVPVVRSANGPLVCSVRFGACLDGARDVETYVVPRDRLRT